MLDPDGPTITTTTLLDNVLSRSGNTYTNLFQDGTLSFAGAKGGDTLGAKTLTITDTTTVQDLMTFMQQSLGIRLPADDQRILFPTTAHRKPPGVSISPNGEIEVVSNVGTDNAVDVPLVAFKLTPTGSSAVTKPKFGFQQHANRQRPIGGGRPYRLRFTRYSAQCSSDNRPGKPRQLRNNLSLVRRFAGQRSDHRQLGIAVGTGLSSSTATATSSRPQIRPSPSTAPTSRAIPRCNSISISATSPAWPPIPVRSRPPTKTAPRLAPYQLQHWRRRHDQRCIQ